MREIKRLGKKNLYSNSYDHCHGHWQNNLIHLSEHMPEGSAFDYWLISYLPTQKSETIEPFACWKTKLSTTHYSEIETPKTGVLSGFPRPMVKPLVPSGILGPFVACLGDTSYWMEQLDGRGEASRPRPLWLWLWRRCGLEDFPRPRPNPFFIPGVVSSPCQVKRKTIVQCPFHFSLVLFHYYWKLSKAYYSVVVPNNLPCTRRIMVVLSLCLVHGPLVGYQGREMTSKKKKV